MKFEVIGHDLHVIAIITITHSVVQGNVTRRKNTARVYAFVIVIVHAYRGTLPFTRKNGVYSIPLYTLHMMIRKLIGKIFTHNLPLQL